MAAYYRWLVCFTNISSVVMPARYVASAFLTAVTTKAGRSLDVHIVTQTTRWIRHPGFPADSVKEEFTKLVKEHGDKFKKGVSTVAMK